MSDETDYSLVLAFDSDEEEFTRGFEAGTIWNRMEHEAQIDAQIHASNTEMVMRMAEAKGFGFRAEDVNDDWTMVHLASEGPST